MPNIHTDHPHPRETAHKLARWALFGFLVTFIMARVFVFLIMCKAIPNRYCFVSGLGDLIGPVWHDLKASPSP